MSFIYILTKENN